MTRDDRLWAFDLRFWSAVFAGSLAAACSSEPVRKLDTTEVPVPVYSTCVAKQDLPAVPRTKMKPDGNVQQLAAGASADVRELALYAAKADALLHQCAE